jgi:hypothetical protein
VQTLVDFVAFPEIQEKPDEAKVTKHSISVWTAHRWLKKLDRRYRHQKNGMYIDGHRQRMLLHIRQSSSNTDLSTMSREWLCMTTIERSSKHQMNMCCKENSKASHSSLSLWHMMNPHYLQMISASLVGFPNWGKRTLS